MPDVLDETTLDHVLGRGRRELARLLPELSATETDGDDGAPGPDSQARLFELLLGVLGRLGEHRPVLLVLEDVHWADRATRDLLRFLAHNTRGRRIAIVVTHRIDEAEVDDGARRLLGDLRRSDRVEHIALERLTRRETELQLAGILGAPADDATVTWVHARADGNPYFAEEVLAAGADARDAVPPGLRDLLLARIRRLPADPRDLVALAATLGAAVDHDVLRRASVLGEPAFAGALRELVDGHVLVPEAGGERYRFRHALGRDAVYEDLLPGERRELHARAAAARVAASAPRSSWAASR